MMKILQIINSLNIGGAERLITDIAPIMDKLGHQTDVLILNDSETSFKKDLIEKGVKVITLSKEGSSPYNPLFIFKLIKHIKQYDIVHVHLFPAQYWVALAKCISAANCKLITTEHSTHNRRRDIRFFSVLDRFIYSKYSKIIAITEKTKNSLADYLGNSERIEVIENGINLSLFFNALPYNKSDLIKESKDSDILVAMVGGFREAKDQDTLIRVFGSLTENYRLILVGDGERKKHCIELVNKLKLQNRIHFLGHRSDIPQILKTIDIYVMSSFWEGLCLAAVEGMAAEKPVVVSNVPGLEEVVEGAGLVFEVGDYKELAKHIEKLGEDIEYRESISSKCLKRSNQYDINMMVEKYLTLYSCI